MSLPKYIQYTKLIASAGCDFPSHWSAVKLNSLAAKEDYALADGPFGSDLKNEEYTEEGVPLIQLNNIGIGVHRIESLNYISEEKADQLRKHNVFPGDLVIAKMAEPVARACIVHGNFPRYVIVADCIRLKTNPELIDSRFAEYAINSSYFRTSAELVSRGTGRIRINLSSLKSLQLGVPTPKEQLAIANFLDRETAKIDSLIAEQQRLIELLQEKRQAVVSHAVTKGLNPNAPMKDSGVEWLGEVPEHWEVKRLKHLLSEPLSYGANEPAESVQLNDPRYIRITDIKDDGSLNPETFRSLSQEKASDYLLEDRDILLARSGATVGKSFMYRSDMGPCCFAGYLILARCSPVGMTPEWVYLFSESAAYWSQIRSDAIQATIQNVSAEKYGNMLLPVPPSSEMQAVIAVARQKADQYAQLIKAADDLIELMCDHPSSPLQ